MATTFSISISMKTLRGIEPFGSFSIGNDRERATDIFQQMEGEPNITQSDVLFVEFTETTNGLPANLKIKSCTLDQIAWNCKLITKELFKLKDIEGLL